MNLVVFVCLFDVSSITRTFTHHEKSDYSFYNFCYYETKVFIFGL